MSKHRSTVAKRAPGQIVVEVTDEKDIPKVRAEVALHPSVNAAVVALAYADDKIDVNAYVEVLSESIKKVTDGDMKQVEGMLLGQASALQSIFMNFAHRAKSQEYLSHMESFMRMAMKAQNQCRMTLETLANVKNPPVVYARQANITNGPQQVNNGVSSADPTARAREEKTIQSNELLETNNGKRMDTGTPSSASNANSKMETVEQVNRAKKQSRKSKVSE